MFRKMRRFGQQLSDEECVRVLQEQKRGVLSMMGDDGYPYGIPIDFWYDQESGHIFFHGARTGKKIDSLRANNKASFCVYDEGYRKEGEWALNIKSIIVIGHICEITDPVMQEKIGRALAARFTQDQEYIDREIKRSLPRVLCLELVPEHMTGKLVHEA